MAKNRGAKAPAREVTRTTLCVSREAYQRLCVTALMENSTAGAIASRAILEHCRSWSLPGKIGARGNTTDRPEPAAQLSESAPALA